MTPNILKKILCLVFALLVSFLLLSHNVLASKVVGNQISNILWKSTENSFEVRISGMFEPIYTTYELSNPSRVVLDIAGGSISPAVSLPFKVSQGPVSEILGNSLSESNQMIARVEIVIDEVLEYSVEKEGTDLVVIFSEVAVGPELIRESAADNQVTITDIQIDAVNATQATVILYSSGPVGDFEVVEQGKDETHSARLLVKLNDVKMEDRVIPVAIDSPVALVQANKAGDGGKIILDSADNELFSYDIQVKDNYMELSLTSQNVGGKEDSQIVALLTGWGAEGSRDFVADTPFVSGQDEFANMAFGSPENETLNVEKFSSNLNFTGYDEQKISVDFYKIDLHNVFRLIGEISNKNVIVDEAVSGSLTLSMKDVPWDFLLDVVLNLKDLTKEERFNTIVISPNSEGFTWPEAAEETQLEVSVEPITVTKRLQTSKEKVNAKRIIHEASKEESKGNDLKALALYEKAFQLWPENADLAKRIATIAMVKLGQNATAAHYSKTAVQIDPQDYKSALIAAMSLANMEKSQEAKEYFDLSISGVKPSKHALASYAAFSEQNGSYDAALSMLDQYTNIYGNSLETMVSRARIYDQMGDLLRADDEYKAILLSGFELPADLKAYITNRVQ